MSNVDFFSNMLLYAFSSNNTLNTWQVYTEKHGLKILVKC